MCQVTVTEPSKVSVFGGVRPTVADRAIFIDAMTGPPAPRGFALGDALDAVEPDAAGFGIDLGLVQGIGHGGAADIDPRQRSRRQPRSWSDPTSNRPVPTMPATMASSLSITVTVTS